jgi:endoglucanase
MALASIGAAAACPPSFAARVAAVAARSDPLSGEPFFVPPGSPAEAQVLAWNASYPTGARLLERIATRPVAIWLGHSDSTGVAAEMSRRAQEEHSIPTFVTYFLPNRDCGGYSSGGAESAVAYKQWVKEIAAAIGDRRAAIIVEPDALSELGCWSPAVANEQLSLIRYSVVTFSRLRHVAVYIDSGNRPLERGWIPMMASRLRSAGIAYARGFAVNTSNFETVAGEETYGAELLAALGGRWHFVIDTSRDGRGQAPGAPWCNPPGRGLGPAPTTNTKDPSVDAYLWVKLPGASDGPCGGGPSAGKWWPEQALELAKNASA